MLIYQNSPIKAALLSGVGVNQIKPKEFFVELQNFHFRIIPLKCDMLYTYFTDY